MKLSEPLLQWYHQNRRILPFREDPTPYHIWVSEIMLQQTRVAAALPYYHRFMQALPNVAALAGCQEEKLLKLWEGLGYYSRARNLQKAAKVVMEQYGGELPASYAQLQKLPGVGAYTAGAIASIAFGLPEVAVDGNVLRVFARLAACTGLVGDTSVKTELSAMVRRHMPRDKAGDYNQAIMELGALVCLPKSPRCGVCPLAAQCRGYRKGIQATLPRKAPRAAKKELDITGLLVWQNGRVLLRQRPPKGLLANLWQPLLWEERLDLPAAFERLRGLFPGGTPALVGPLPFGRHVFTHKIWRLAGWECTLQGALPPPGEGFVFATPEEVAGQYAVPGAFSAWLPRMLAGPPDVAENA